MHRWRTLGALLVLATAGLVAPGTPASAASPLRATVICNPRTGSITTSTAGALLRPGTPTAIRVEFLRRTAYRVTAAGVTVLPQAPPYVVTATTNSAGEIAATGYTGTFDPASALFYREQLTVTYYDASTGSQLTSRDASCSSDRRTTVTLACDPAAGTVTATVTGVNGHLGGTDGAGRAYRVGYHRVRTSQADPNEPGFRTELLNGAYDVEHRITRADDGSWTDAGYAFTLPLNHYYYAEELTVGVHDSSGRLIGGGTAACVLFPGGTA